MKNLLILSFLLGILVYNYPSQKKNILVQKKEHINKCFMDKDSFINENKSFTPFIKIQSFDNYHYKVKYYYKRKNIIKSINKKIVKENINFNKEIKCPI